VDELRRRLAGLTGSSPTKVGRQIQSFIDSYTHHPSKLLGPAEKIGASVVGALFALIVVLLTALYTAIHPEPLYDGLVRVVPPARRPKAEVILSRLRTAYLGWLRGLVIGMVVLGTLTYLGLMLVGLPFAAFFAVFTAVAMIVPYFGALVSSIIPILFALTISPGKAVLVALVYIGTHELESNVIQPQVVARTVELHPAVVAFGVIAVEQLFGFVGLIVAVPILGTLKILLEELWIAPLEEGQYDALVEQPPQISAVRGRQRIADGAARAGASSTPPRARNTPDG
jgi:predicted PurR-regulated permease PerM